jgi:hypothetical protein
VHALGGAIEGFRQLAGAMRIAEVVVDHPAAGAADKTEMTIRLVYYTSGLSVHCVVPGGGPSLDGTRWVACRPGFFLPVRVLW